MGLNRVKRCLQHSEPPADITPVPQQLPTRRPPSSKPSIASSKPEVLASPREPSAPTCPGSCRMLPGEREMSPAGTPVAAGWDHVRSCSNNQNREEAARLSAPLPESGHPRKLRGW